MSTPTSFHKTMPLARQVGLLLAVGYGLMATCLIWTLSQFQFAESLKTEQQLARKDLSQLLVSLDKVKSKLVAHHEEWTHWDEAYEFVRGSNPKFKSEYLDSIDGLTMVTHYLYLDAKRRVITNGVRDYGAGTITPIGKATQEQILSALLSKSEREGMIAPHAGLLLVEGKPYYVAIGPVTPMSAEPDQGIGALIFSLALTPETLAEISRDMDLPVELVTRADPRFETQLKSFIQNTDAEKKVSLMFGADENVHASGLLKDVTGEPIAFLNTYAPEQIYSRSKHSFKTVFLLICLFALATMLLSQLIMRKYLVSPLEALSGYLNDVSEHREAKKPLLNSGGFEFGIIVDGINKAFLALGTLERELRESRDSAIAANEAKSSFVAKVSHELRTPIHGILGLLRIIKKKVTDDGARMQLGMVRDSTVGLLGVVNDILDFSKGEVGDLPVTAAPMNLRDSVRHAMRIVAPRLFERSESDLIECFASVAPNIADDVHGDSKRISQILINLLGNAIKFTKRGSVSLTVRRAGHSERGPLIAFTVTDTGIGIPADKLKMIFEPFKQVDDSITRQYSGTGLGLAIVSQLATAMGGDVSVSSEVGKGSSFTVRIPLKELGVPREACETLLAKNVWIINNAVKEAEMVGQSLRQSKISVWCDSTDTLAGQASPNPALSEVGALVVAGNTLVNPATWGVIQEMVKRRGPQQIIATLSQHELSFRERLLSLGVSKILLTPLITEDVLDVLQGRFTDSFAGYDDFMEEESRPKSGLTMLVADDILTNQIVLRSTLQKLGHDVTVVSNGMEVLEAVGHQIGLRPKGAQDKTYDLLLIDVQMPVMDGLEAIRQIRQNEAKLETRIPILSVTAHAYSEEHSKMLQAGADGVLPKPIDDRELVRLIERYARMSEANSDSAQAESFTQKQERVDAALSIENILQAIDDLDERVAEAHGLSHAPGLPTLIDTNRLRQRVGSDLSLLTELLSSFRSTVESLQSQLRASLHEHEMNALERTSHSLKGSLAEMGCDTGAVLAQDIVNLCRTQDYQPAIDKAVKLMDILQCSTTMLRSVLSKVAEERASITS